LDLRPGSRGHGESTGSMAVSEKALIERQQLSLSDPSRPTVEIWNSDRRSLQALGNLIFEADLMLETTLSYPK